MVAMGVGDHHVGHRLAGNGLEHRIHMLRRVRAGVEDGHVTMADDIGAGAREGEGGRIGGHDAAHQRRHVHRLANGGIEIAVEGNVSAHARRLDHFGAALKQEKMPFALPPAAAAMDRQGEGPSMRGRRLPSASSVSQGNGLAPDPGCAAVMGRL